MPALTAGFAIYQTVDGFTVTEKGTNHQWLVEYEDEVRIGMKGIEGCMISLWVNEEYMGDFKNPNIKGKWTIGRGFKERYWTGNFSF